MDCNRFYSPFISGMQRLPNGKMCIRDSLVAAVGFSAVPVIGVMCRAIIPLAEEAWRFIFYFGGVGLIAFFVGLRYLKESDVYKRQCHRFKSCTAHQRIQPLTDSSP